MTPFTVPGVVILASSVVKRSIPPVFSSTPISTLTPHTITTTDHGTLFRTGPPGAHPTSTSRLAPANPDRPGFAFRTTTPPIHTAVTASVTQCIGDIGETA